MRVVVALVGLIAGAGGGGLAGCAGGGRSEPAAGEGPDPGAAPVGVAASGAAAGATGKPGAAEAPSRAIEVVECPVSLAGSPADEEKVAALLEAANQAITDARFGAAWTCADRAADLAPASVEAHHLRGAALAGLGRADEAQLAYSLALALDPDDPETLRAVADFYINGKGEHGRDALRLGLELAQRGTRRVLVRRRKSTLLAADLALLEGQALNDLGRSDEALARIDVSLKHAPGRADALHERGVALFDLSRFTEAKAAFEKALALQPTDAFSHQLMGLTLEQLGDPAGAERELLRAVELAPGELAPPVLIEPAELRHEIDAVIAMLDEGRRARVHDVRIEVVDLPDPIDLKAVRPPFPPTILGLYRGPVGHGHGHGHGPAGRGALRAEHEPTSIVLYRKNLARAVKTRAELNVQIRETLLHEIGHLEGFDEDDLRRRGMD
ncbi:MAG TPA: metallopeptidase family protein [Kofleriaceae bacterium]|nr:metallopeptidase family protein [Kofleriaceae bacterium]